MLVTLPLPELVAVIASSAVILASLFGFLGWVAWDVSRRGKARVIWYDPDAAETPISWHRVVDGNHIVLGSRRKARRFRLESAARLPGRVPTWIIHSRHGWNWTDPATIPAELRELPTYKAFGDAATVHKHPLIKALVVTNPAGYHKEVSINRPRNAIKSNDDTDHSAIVIPIVIGSVVVLGAFIGLIWYLVSKIGGGI